MIERRWPWSTAAALMLAAAGAAAAAVHLHWLPCRGSLLSGSVVRGYRYGPDFTDACLQRMDGSLPYASPLEPSLDAAAMALAGLAWLVLVLGMRWSLRTVAVAALPGLAMLAIAARAGITVADPEYWSDEYLSGWLALGPEASTLVALIVISRWQRELRGLQFLRLVVVAWGVTAFGLVRGFGDYLVMGVFSDANWDTPPLTGYLIVATVVVCAILPTVLPRLLGRGATTVGSATVELRAPQPAGTSGQQESR